MHDRNMAVSMTQQEAWAGGRIVAIVRKKGWLAKLRYRNCTGATTCRIR